MTIFPRMGTALIDAVGVEKRSPSGSLLTVAKNKQLRLPGQCVVRDVNDHDVVSVDWIHSEVPLVGRLQEVAGLRNPNAAQIEEAFR